MQGFYDFSDLRIGMRVSVEGAFADGAFRAHTISIKGDGDMDEIEAMVESADTVSGTLRILGLAVAIGDGVEMKGLDKQALRLEEIQPGTRLKTKGHALDGRRFQPVKIKAKSRTPDEMDQIESAITALDPQARTLSVMGFLVRCDEDCEIEA